MQCWGNPPKQTDDAGEKCCPEQMQTVTLWNYTPPLPQIPHTFLETPFRTRGFYPLWGGWPLAPGDGWPLAPGDVRDDYNHPRNPRGKPYKVCPKTLERLDRSIDGHSGGLWGDWYGVQNPFGGYNCTSWACARLRDAGLIPPSNPNLPFINPWSNQNNMNQGH